MTVNTDEFIKNSSLEVLVPEATDVDIEELLTHETVDSEDVISSVERRSLLYFGILIAFALSLMISLILRYVLDESITAYFIFRTPNQDEACLKAHFSRLVFNLEVQAHGLQSRPSSGQNAANESSPSRSEDTLWSGRVDTSQNPIIIWPREKQQHSAEYLLAIWKDTFPLCRPRMRLQSPTIVFKPTASLQPSKDEGSKKISDPYLPSGVPASVNLLESLKLDPAIQRGKPTLSASRLSRIRPLDNEIEATDRTIKTRIPRAFRALPAVSSRLRYSRANDKSGKPSIIVSLDIETSPFSSDTVKLTAVDMELSDGSTEDLGKYLLPLIPLECQPKDNPVFLFRLNPREPSSATTHSSSRTVLVSLHATVFVSPICQPKIEMRWKTGVDFSTALNPVYGAPSQSMQRHRRPNNLSRTNSNNNINNAPASTREAELAEKRQQAVSLSDFGVSVTFTAPKKVQVGQPFLWRVLVLNRSTKSRQLTLTVLPKRKKASTTDHVSKPASASAVNGKGVDTADTVTDENSLYAMQRNVGVDLGEVICLTTDIRIGTLNPGSCLETELKFLPLVQGYLRLEAVRLTDVLSNELMDIRDLPDIVAE